MRLYKYLFVSILRTTRLISYSKYELKAAVLLSFLVSINIIEAFNYFLIDSINLVYWRAINSPLAYVSLFIIVAIFNYLYFIKDDRYLQIAMSKKKNRKIIEFCVALLYMVGTISIMFIQGKSI